MQTLVQEVVIGVIASAVWAGLVFAYTHLTKSQFLQKPVTTWKALLVAGIIAIVTFLLTASIVPRFDAASSAQTSIPSVSIVSARYAAGGFDPHLIDFRTVSEDGIPFGEDQSLRITDIWMWGSEDAPGYKVQADLYVNHENIGSSPSVELQKGIHRLGDILPQKYFFENLRDAWAVQSNWQALDLVLSIYSGADVVHQEHFQLKQNGNGLSRMQTMPEASFFAIVYSINNAPQQLLDVRTIMPTGIKLHAGDQLWLDEVWYNTATTIGSKTFTISAYLTHDGYNEATDKTSPSNTFMSGLHPVGNFQRFQWPIEPDYLLWVISLERDDNALLDRLLLPINVIP